MGSDTHADGKPIAKPRIDQVLAEGNLFEAWLKVLENQGCAGSDGESLADFGNALSRNLATLESEVRYGTYRPKALLRVEIDKDTAGRRPLSIPAVRDRVLQSAVARVLTPIFEAEFEDCSFAYRKGRSVEQAVQRVIQFRDAGFRWVVDADIHGFFDEIDHSLLLERIQALISDEAILRLIRLWLGAEVIDGERRFRLGKGVPQGSPLSPLLSNLYLDHLDDALLERELRLVRFADDFLILCKSQAHAEDALELSEEVLGRLKLNINRDKTSVLSFDRGFRFLGVEFIRSLAFPAEAGDTLEAGFFEPGTRTKEPREEAPEAPLGEIASAFREAGIGARDFPAEASHPVESDFVPEEAEGATFDPRLRSLYLLRHGLVLGKESERLVVRAKRKVVKEIPAIKVDQILIFGNAQITTQAMQFCLEESIPIFLLSGRGRYYGVVDSFETDPVLLHRDQFQRTEDANFCTALAREFVRGKVSNSRLVLARQARKRSAPAFEEGTAALKLILGQLDQAESLEQLRGYEGSAAKIYFAAIAKTLDAAWGFSKRIKQPPRDPINAMLSYGYTLLFYNMYSLIRARGLNPHVGYLHRLRAGHPALASDLIEEFRAPVVDAVVLKLVLNSRVSPRDFDDTRDGSGACLMNDQARGLLIRELESKLNSPVRHPVSHFRIDYRRCMEHQIQHLAAVIRGWEAHYHPALFR
ncbi:MAG: CRISPR-associated endonuclease Cas1 [Gammaproteobacteria bacterium]